MQCEHTAEIIHVNVRRYRYVVNTAFYVVNVGGYIHAETKAFCKVNYDFSADCPDDDERQDVNDGHSQRRL